MKKLIAFSFLVLHLLCLASSVVAREIAVYQSDRFFEKQISRGFYNLNDLTEVRISTNTRATSGWNSYVRISGKVIFANNAYNYVAMKVTKGAVYLLCIPNYKTTHFCKTNIIDARNIPDIPVNKKEHVPFGKVSDLNIFYYRYADYCFSTPVLAIVTSQGNIVAQVAKSSIATPAQPPEIC